MNIDWNELKKGFEDAQTKQAGIMDGVKKVWDKIKGPAAKAVGVGAAGYGAKEGLGYLKNQAGEYLGNAAPAAAGLAANLLGGAAGKPGVGNFQMPVGNLLLPQNGGVSSLGAPKMMYNPAAPRIVQASENEKISGIMSDMSDAARKRLANHVINEVTKTNPLGMSISQEQPEAEQKEKELEIVSKYPEMAKVLENEQNKEYLKRLLKE